MYYEFDLSGLPEVTSIYTVRRRTVWQIVDPDSLLIFAAEGRCRITLDNIEYTLEEGVLIFVPAGHFYIRRPVGDEFCTMYYAHIRLCGGVKPLDTSEAREHLAARLQKRSRALTEEGRRESPSHIYMLRELTPLPDRQDEILSLYNEAMAANLRNQPDSPTLESMLISRLLLIAASAAADELAVGDTQLPLPDTNRKLDKVFSYIRLHAKESVSLDDLCAVCNFSKQHLIRVFSAEFGMTPKAYILAYRVNRAKEMFYRNPHLSVKEVADEMGFADQHYFTRLFVKIAGMTPSAYKRHLLTFDPSKQ